MSDYLQELNNLGCDPFQVLGVELNARLEDIQSMYRKKALVLHPDKNLNDPNANTKFNHLREVYLFLKDEQKRSFASLHFSAKTPVASKYPINLQIKKLQESLIRKEKESSRVIEKQESQIDRIRSENRELIMLEQMRREDDLVKDRSLIIQALKSVDIGNVSDQDVKQLQLLAQFSSSDTSDLNEILLQLGIQLDSIIDIEIFENRSSAVITFKDRETAINARLSYKKLKQNFKSLLNLDLVMSAEAVSARKAAETVLLDPAPYITNTSESFDIDPVIHSIQLEMKGQALNSHRLTQSTKVLVLNSDEKHITESIESFEKWVMNRLNQKATVFVG